MKRKPFFTEDCENCGRRGRTVLCDLAGDKLAAFQLIKHTLYFEPRQTVFYEGHASLGFYVLCAGRVKLTRCSAGGQRQIVRLLDGGEAIEKQAFRDQAVHEVTCETMAPSQICVIEREPYLALVRQNSELAFKVIRLLSCEVGRQMDQLDRFAFLTARQRFAGLLLELGKGREGGEDGARPVGIALKRGEVAEMAGVAVETAIRLLGAFREEGLVQVDGRQITLLKPERLARIARI
jgi:CRP/FNR family transcriptional regulator